MQTDDASAADLTSVALMACGIGTFLHVVRFKIPYTRFYYGTGIVSVLGITTTQIVVGLNSISQLQVASTTTFCMSQFSHACSALTVCIGFCSAVVITPRCVGFLPV